MDKKTINKIKKIPMKGNARKGFKAYVGIILCFVMLFTFSVTALAADDPQFLTRYTNNWQCEQL